MTNPFKHFTSVTICQLSLESTLFTILPLLQQRVKLQHSYLLRVMGHENQKKRKYASGSPLLSRLVCHTVELMSWTYWNSSNRRSQGCNKCVLKHRWVLEMSVGQNEWFLCKRYGLFFTAYCTMYDLSTREGIKNVMPANVVDIWHY